MFRLSYPVLVVVALAASAFAAPVTSTVAVAKRASPIMNDIFTITTKIANLDAALQSFKGGKPEAKVIYQDMADLGTSVAQTAKDVAASEHFSKADGSPIVAAAEKLSSKVGVMLKDIVAKRSAFEAAAPASVQTHMAALDSAVMAFMDSLKGAVSSQEGLKLQVTAVKTVLEVAFRAAKAAYH
jgi:hypothetical protein